MALTQSIGKMREVVEFRQNSPTPQGAGYVDNYTTLLTTRGQFINSGDSRSLSFGALTDNVNARLIVRFQTALAAGLRSDTKIIINNITYTMQGMPKLIDQIKHLYEFRISAETN